MARFKQETESISSNKQKTFKEKNQLKAKVTEELEEKPVDNQKYKTIKLRLDKIMKEDDDDSSSKQLSN